MDNAPGIGCHFSLASKGCRVYLVFWVSLFLAFSSAFSFCRAVFSSISAFMTALSCVIMSFMRMFKSPICGIMGEVVGVALSCSLSGSLFTSRCGFSDFFLAFSKMKCLFSLFWCASLSDFEFSRLSRFFRFQRV